MNASGSDMAEAQHRLAQALKVLKGVQVRQQGVLQAGDIQEADRLLLVEEGFLKPVIKGWYICANPNDRPGDSTAWYVSYWVFLAAYLEFRFGSNYCLNPEASLKLHTGNTLVPEQMVVVTSQGGTSTLTLPFGSSLLIYEDSRNFPQERTRKKGLQVSTLPESLCRLPPRIFQRYPHEVEIALGMIRDVGELLTILLQRENMASAAGRLTGALRFMQRDDDAQRVIETMRIARHRVRETNPFSIAAPSLGKGHERSPYALRLASMWSSWREDVQDEFPAPPGLPDAIEGYLQDVDERYVADAYHSLSIEGYKVTEELIERIAREGWNPAQYVQDNEDRNAMAAKGYLQAFRAVRRDLISILEGGNPGAICRTAHHRWYAELFAPSVEAGIIEPKELAGYRTGPVFIRNARHIPLPPEALMDAMEMLFNLIEHEEHPAVRAVLGHHLLVFIHPWFDGNGRIGRFLMNALLASGGYPWTVIRVEHRQSYMQALDEASSGGNIRPLAAFIVRQMQEDA